MGKGWTAWPAGLRTRWRRRRGSATALAATIGGRRWLKQRRQVVHGARAKESSEWMAKEGKKVEEEAVVLYMVREVGRGREEEWRKWGRWRERERVVGLF